MDIWEIKNLFKIIQDYRDDILKADNYNNSVMAKLLFWKKKRTVFPPDIPKSFFIIVKDCYILFYEYKQDCEKAREEYMNKCREKLEMSIWGRKVDRMDNLKQNLMEISLKYKGKKILKVS